MLSGSTLLVMNTLCDMNVEVEGTACTVASTIIYCCTSQQCYSQLVSHSQSMYISSSFNPMFSLTFTEVYWHSLTSVSSLTALFLLFFFLLTVVVNHGPPQAHQVLPAGHLCESHPAVLQPLEVRQGSCFTKVSFGPQMKVSRTFVNDAGAVQGGVTRDVFEYPPARVQMCFLVFFTSCHRTHRCFPGPAHGVHNYGSCTRLKLRYDNMHTQCSQM